MLGQRTPRFLSEFPKRSSLVDGKSTATTGRFRSSIITAPLNAPTVTRMTIRIPMVWYSFFVSFRVLTKSVLPSGREVLAIAAQREVSPVRAYLWACQWAWRLQLCGRSGLRPWQGVEAPFHRRGSSSGNPNGVPERQQDMPYKAGVLLHQGSALVPFLGCLVSSLLQSPM